MIITTDGKCFRWQETCHGAPAPCVCLVAGYSATPHARTHTQTNKQKNKQTNKHKHTHTNKQTQTHTQTHTHRDADTHHTQAGRQAGRQARTDGRTDARARRRTDAQTQRRRDAWTHGHTDTRTHGHTDTQRHRDTETACWLRRTIVNCAQRLSFEVSCCLAWQERASVRSGVIHVVLRLAVLKSIMTRHHRHTCFAGRFASSNSMTNPRFRLFNRRTKVVMRGGPALAANVLHFPCLALPAVSFV